MSAKQHSTLLGKVLVALKYISLIVITLVCLAPIILAAVTSLKSKTEVYDLGVLQLPETLHFENYITAFVDGNMLNGFKNTAIMVGVSLIFVILNGTMVAYILSRFEFQRKKSSKKCFLVRLSRPEHERSSDGISHYQCFRCVQYADGGFPSVHRHRHNRHLYFYAAALDYFRIAG